MKTTAQKPLFFQKCGDFKFCEVKIGFYAAVVVISQIFLQHRISKTVIFSKIKEFKNSCIYRL